ncbi:MAG: sulfatase [Actinomycetota bacterium]
MGTRAKRIVAGAVAMGVPVLVVVLAGCGGEADRTAAQGPQRDDRPNVVMVMTDDQTVEQMQALPKTRALIGDAGTTFVNNFSTFPLCCPSRSTYITGQYPHNHKVRGNKPDELGGYRALYRERRPNGKDTLPVWMRNAGYSTAHIGKYLNGYRAERQPNGKPERPNGWQNWQGSVDPATYNYRNYCLNENGTLVWYGRRNRCPQDQPNTPGGQIHQGDNYTQKAVAYIRDAPRNRPFFLSVAYLAPHGGGPNTPRCGGSAKSPPRHAGAFNGIQLPPKETFNEEQVGDKPSSIRSLPRFDAAAAEEIRRRYQCRRESLLHVDEGVEAIVNGLRARGELDNTVIIFTADNGFFTGEHRIQGGKIHHYEEASRVPLLMRGPGVPQRRVFEQVANVDLASTILDAGNARPTRVQDGRSLLRTAANPKATINRDILLENGPKLPPGYQYYRAIRTPRFKFVRYGNGERELYDLLADPLEERSRHRVKRYNRVERRLARRLRALQDCKGASCRKEFRK